MSEEILTKSDMKCIIANEALEAAKKWGKSDEKQAKYSLVFFDIETTGLEVVKDEIIQIAAKCGGETFKRQILPTKPLDPIITKITGISVYEGVMYNRQNEILETVSKQLAMKNFLHFLSSLDGKKILIAHYCHKFDALIVTRVMQEVNMFHEFENIVDGFSDTYPLFKSKLPGRLAAGKNYKLAALANEFLGIQNGMHDAMNDVIALEKLTLVLPMTVSMNDFMKYWRSTQMILIDLLQMPGPR